MAWTYSVLPKLLRHFLSFEHAFGHCAILRVFFSKFLVNFGQPSFQSVEFDFSGQLYDFIIISTLRGKVIHDHTHHSAIRMKLFFYSISNIHHCSYHLFAEFFIGPCTKLKVKRLQHKKIILFEIETFYIQMRVGIETHNGLHVYIYVFAYCKCNEFDVPVRKYVVVQIHTMQTAKKLKLSESESESKIQMDM